MFQKRFFPSFYTFLASSLLVFIFSNCKNDNDKPNVPDVSGITSDIKIHRFDQDIYAIDTLNTEGGVKAIEQKYPEFSNLYFERVIGIKDAKDSVGKYRTQVRAFLTNAAMRGMMDTINLIYKNFDGIKQEIDEGLRFYKHYFPNKLVPTDIYTMPSAYNFAAVLPNDTTVAIGLDMFLGENHSTYEALPTTFLTCAAPGVAACALTVTNNHAAANRALPKENIEVRPKFFIKPVAVTRSTQFPRWRQRIEWHLKVNPRFPVCEGEIAHFSKVLQTEV